VTKIRFIAIIYINLLIGTALSACGNNQTAQPKDYPDEGTPQARLYVEKCSQCHAAPLPGAHTANVWPSVLDRMQMHITTNNLTPLTRQQMSIILGYLLQHAQKSPQ